MAGDRQKTSPWSEAQRNMQLEMWRRGSELFNTWEPNLYSRYEGNINAGPSQATNRYIQMLQNAAQYNPQLHKFEGIPGFDLELGGQQVRDAANQLGTDKWLSPDSNPYLRQTVEAATGDIGRQFTRQTLPGLQSAAVAGGAYGGSQMDKLATLRNTEAQRNAQGVAAQMYGQNFANERQLMQQGQLALPGFYNAAANLDVTQQMVPRQFAQSERAFAQNQDLQNRQWQVANQQRQLGYQGQAGQLTDVFRQRDAEEQLQRWQMEQQRHMAAQQLPWQRFQMAMPLAFQNSGQNNEGPLVAAASDGGGGGFGGAIQGALGAGMGVAGLARGTGMAGNPWLIGAGALAGGAGGWFG
jgi:hypothetical protein